MGPFGNFLSARSGRDAVAVLFGLMGLALVMVSPSLYLDGDTNWHVTTGLWILEHHAVPSSDIFSFTAPGRKWVTHEWLAELFMGLSFKAAGWSGVRALTAGAFAVTAAVLAQELLRRLGLIGALIVTAMVFPVLVPHVIARPHALALPLMALFVAGLLRARRTQQAPSPSLLLLMVGWANTHGSYILGPVFTGFMAVEAVMDAPSRERRRVIVTWGAFITAATACCLVTPSFIDGFLYPFTLVNMKSISSISEWSPVDFSQPSLLEAMVLGAVFFLIYKRVAVGVARLALVLILVHMTFQHVRQEFVLVLVGAMLLAEPIGRAMAQPGEPQVADAASLEVRHGRRARLVLAAGLATIIALVGARLAIAERRVDSEATPIVALAHVPAEIRARPVFNEYSFGGWLIFNHVRSFIDGRNDMYGDALFQQYLDCAHGNATRLAEVFAKYRIGWVILPPSSKALAWLVRQPGWRRLYADTYAVVYVRDPALPPTH